MLMDEPFGAVDPITREHLQDEFLNLQRRLRKTIVFVTHDFDEAVKMGDRIAVLREGSEIAQYATPEEILTNPADDFVAGFVGRGAVLKRLRLEPVDAMGLGPAHSADGVRVPVTASMHDALDAMLGSGAEVVGVTDADDRVVGSVRLSDIISRLAAVGAKPTDMETLAAERAT
jgi:osmoprotectant transport system ATP-binding protein